MVEAFPLEGGTVEPGTAVTINMVFSGDPAEVYASFTRPNVTRAVVDPGYGREGSRIRRVGVGHYTYVIDTAGFRAGRVDWHFWAPNEPDPPSFGAPAYGSFVVRDRPAQLL